VLTAAGAAFAADAPSTVQEVIVTANKRSESIQKVPMSIQALDTKKLEELNVSEFEDYAKLLPSLDFQTAGPSSTTLIMRGVASGEDGNHSGPLPSVGVYLDEQPITTISGTLDIHMYDIARVEALAGPQGTLYGASSESGTLRIITNKPSTAGFSGAYDVEGNTVAPHGAAGGIVEGYVNIPINDKMAIRLVGFDEHDGGYIDNVHGTRTFSTFGQFVDNAAFVKKDFNDVDTYGGRAALGINLNESWTITPTIMGQWQNTHGLFGFEPKFGDLKTEQFGPNWSKDQWYQAALTVQGKLGKYDLTYSGGYFNRHVTAETSYMDYSYYYDQVIGSGVYWLHDVGSNTPVANPMQTIHGDDHFWKTSNEIRLASPSTDRFRFIVGAFAQRQAHWIIQDYTIAGLDPTLAVPRWPDTYWLTDQMRVDYDEAIYGEATYDITPKFSVTAGIRFYDFRNSLKGFFGFSQGLADDFGFGSGFGAGGSNCTSTKIYRNGPGCFNLDKVSAGKGDTWKLNATYHLDPDKMLYATVATGYRPGGVNRHGDLPPYQADYLESYEIGWKTSWLDHRLRWNGAIYQENWNNFQFSFLGINSLTQIVNAGAARIRGVESDLNWRVTDHFDVTAAGAYTDARLTTPYCGATLPDGTPITVCPGPADPLPPQAPSGQQLPVTPKFKGNLTARYTWDWGDWKAHLEGVVVYQAAAWADLHSYERALFGEMPAFTTADFSFGVEHNKMSMELFAKNAFDERGIISRGSECTVATDFFKGGGVQIPICGNAVYSFPVRPRLIGLKFGQKF
jgi:outer membrane receptor protein involved in Fe transport